MSTTTGRRPERNAALRLSALKTLRAAGGSAVDLLESRVLFSSGFPIVQSMLRGTPSSPGTSASAVSYLVTFDQPVTGVDSSDFKVITSGGASASSTVLVTPNGPAIYSI